MINRKSIECHNLKGGTSQLILLLSKDPETYHVGMQIYNAGDNHATPTYDFDHTTANEFLVNLLTMNFINTGFMVDNDLREVLNFIRSEDYA